MEIFYFANTSALPALSNVQKGDPSTPWVQQCSSIA
jgi:hypothetical protein